jgi:TM2 domain-containing membrane protein YozV
MKWIKKYYLIFIFLCAISSTSKGENDSVLIKADSLFSIGKYKTAAIEYERFIYFSGEEQDLLKTLYKKAQCYKQLFDFTKSCKTLERINLFRENIENYTNVKKELSLSYYLDNKLQKAQIQITQLRHKLRNKNLPNETLLIEIFILNEMKQWAKAQERAKEYVNNQASLKDKLTVITKQIDYLYSKKNLPRLKSVDKAENLSRFIPGAGQIYCGKIAEGSFTFLFNGAFLALGAQQILTKFYFTGYTAGFGVLHKTYTGNMSRTRHIADKTNHHRHNSFNESIIKYMLSL